MVSALGQGLGGPHYTSSSHNFCQTFSIQKCFGGWHLGGNGAHRNDLFAKFENQYKEIIPSSIFWTREYWSELDNWVPIKQLRRSFLKMCRKTEN